METSNQFKIIILAIIGFVLVSTNPAKNKHCNSLKNEAGWLGGKVICTMSTYNDYYLFSTTEVDGEVLSIGLLGKVAVIK